MIPVVKIVIVNDNAYKNVHNILYHSPILKNGNITQEWNEVDEQRLDAEGKMHSEIARRHL